MSACCRQRRLPPGISGNAIRVRKGTGAGVLIPSSAFWQVAGVHQGSESGIAAASNDYPRIRSAALAVVMAL
jgi:hypothetical protein